MPARSVSFEWKSFNSLIDALSNELLLFAAVVVLVTAYLADAKNCTTTLDCNGDRSEKCCNGTFTNNIASRNVCRLNDDCLSSQVCCSSRCIAGGNCLQQSCSRDNDCQRNETCCYGFCKRYGQCVDVVLVVILCVVIISILTFCSCACGKILSNPKKMRFSSLNLSSEMTLSKNLIRTERECNSNEGFNVLCTLFGPPAKLKAYHFASKSNALISNDKIGIDAEGRNKPVTHYGSTVFA